MPEAFSAAVAPSPPAPLLNGERLFSPARVAKEMTNVPGHRGGPHLNGSTIFRHITKGVRAANGERIRLEAVRVGARWLTSIEAFARFSARLTEASISDPLRESLRPPTPAQRNRAADRAREELGAILGPS